MKTTVVIETEDKKETFTLSVGLDSTGMSGGYVTMTSSNGRKWTFDSQELDAAIAIISSADSDEDFDELDDNADIKQP